MMYYANQNSRSKLFHAADCGYLRDKSALLEFETEESARESGFRQCDRCAAISKMYIKGNRQQIDELCEKYKLSVKLYDGRLYVFKGDSGWMMLVNKQGDLILFHRNEKSKHNVIQSKLSAYHKQNVRFKSVERYLRYILHHESLEFQEKRAYQNAQRYAPHGKATSKKEFKKRKKKIKKRFGVARTIKALRELKK